MCGENDKVAATTHVFGYMGLFLVPIKAFVQNVCDKTESDYYQALHFRLYY